MSGLAGTGLFARGRVSGRRRVVRCDRGQVGLAREDRVAAPDHDPDRLTVRQGDLDGLAVTRHSLGAVDTIGRSVDTGVVPVAGRFSFLNGRSLGLERALQLVVQLLSLGGEAGPGHQRLPVVRIGVEADCVCPGSQHDGVLAGLIQDESDLSVADVVGLGSRFGVLLSELGVNAIAGVRDVGLNVGRVTGRDGGRRCSGRGSRDSG